MSQQSPTTRSFICRHHVIGILSDWQQIQTLKLHAGELSAQEVRTIKAVLGAIESEVARLPDAEAQGASPPIKLATL